MFEAFTPGPRPRRFASAGGVRDVQLAARAVPLRVARAVGFIIWMTPIGFMVHAANIEATFWRVQRGRACRRVSKRVGRRSGVCRVWEN